MIQLNGLAEYVEFYCRELHWRLLPCWWVDNAQCACGKPDCGSPGKHPSRQVRNGVKNATANLEQVRSWWEAEPLANIALATSSEHLVLDADDEAAIEFIEQRLERLPLAC